MTEANFRENKLKDIAFWGLRAAVGVIFIVQGSGKFDPGVAGFLTNIGLPVEMQIPIALAETIGGIFLIVGVLSEYHLDLILIFQILLYI